MQYINRMVYQTHYVQSPHQLSKKEQLYFIFCKCDGIFNTAELPSFLKPHSSFALSRVSSKHKILIMFWM